VKHFVVYTIRGTFFGKVKTTSPLTLEEPLLLVAEPTGRSVGGVGIMPLPVTEITFQGDCAYGPATEALVELVRKAKVEQVGIKPASVQDLSRAGKVFEFDRRLKG